MCIVNIILWSMLKLFHDIDDVVSVETMRILGVPYYIVELKLERKTFGGIGHALPQHSNTMLVDTKSWIALLEILA